MRDIPEDHECMAVLKLEFQQGIAPIVTAQFNIIKVMETIDDMESWIDEAEILVNFDHKIKPLPPNIPSFINRIAYPVLSQYKYVSPDLY